MKIYQLRYQFIYSITVARAAVIMVLFSIEFDAFFAQEIGALFTDPLLYTHTWQEIWIITLTTSSVVTKLSRATPRLQEILSSVECMVIMNTNSNFFMFFTFAIGLGCTLFCR